MRTKANLLLLVLAVATVAAATSCSKSDSRAAVDSRGTSTPADTPPLTEAFLADSVNAFACDLHRALAKETSGNLTWSPLSVSAAMGLVYAGSKTITRSEMRNVLHLPADDARAYDGYRSLFAHLDRQAKQGGSRWTLANRTWVEKEFALLPAYLETTRRSFGSAAGTLDFRGAAEAGRVTINQWVEKQTEERIRDLFPPGSINADTRLVLANAIYFKGRWAEQFDKSQTRPETFHTGAGGTVMASTMFIRRTFPIATVPGGRLLELPYQGRRLSMLVLLPDEVGGLPALEGRLGGDSLKAWTAGLEERSVRVGLPRFMATSRFELNEPLAALGMPSTFKSGSADLSGMTGGRDLYLSLVVHKAFVEVSEEGTEAAAATGGVATISTVPMSDEFLVDRPFLFFIRDRASGCILFVGRVDDPTR